MVQKKATTKRRAALEDPDPGVDTGEDAALKSGDTDIFSRATAAFGADPDGIKLQVFRMELGEDDAWLDAFDYDPEQHDAEFLRVRYGAGKYRLKFRDRNYRYVMSQKIAIAPRPGDDPIPSSAGGGGSDRLLEMLIVDRNRSHDDFTKLVTGLLLREGGSSSDGPVTKLMEVMSAQNSALLNAMLLNRSAAVGPGDTVLKALEAGLRVASDVKSDSEGGWLGVIRSLAKDLGPVLTEVMAQRPPPVPRPPAPPVPGAPVSLPSGPPAVPPPSEPPPSEPPPITAASPPDDPALVAATYESFLKRTLPVIDSWASQGMDPREAAGEILDSVGVAYHPLFDNLSAADVITLQPSLGSYKTHDGGNWLEQVLGHLSKREDWTATDEIPPEGAG